MEKKVHFSERSCRSYTYPMSQRRARGIPKIDMKLMVQEHLCQATPSLNVSEERLRMPLGTHATEAGVCPMSKSSEACDLERKKLSIRDSSHGSELGGIIILPTCVH